MARNRNQGPGAFGTLLAIGVGAAAGVAIYRNREWLKSFFGALNTAPAAQEDTAAEVEEIHIVIDRSDEADEADTSEEGEA